MGRGRCPQRYPVTDAGDFRGWPWLSSPLSLALTTPPARPSSVRHHLQALDRFARENIRSLYQFNFSEDGDVPFADDQGPQPAFYLDRSVRLQRLSHPGGQSRVGFRLVSVPRPERSWRAVILQGSALGVGRQGGCAVLTPCPSV